MAMTEIIKTPVPFAVPAAMPAGVGIDPADGAYVRYDRRDGAVLLVLESTGGEADVTVKKGDSVMAAGSDLIVHVGAGEKLALTLESGRYLVTSGENKGRVLFAASAAGINLSAVVLPQ